ncbi:hypothetical protein AX17_003255 [Amanita inopinata Kibby_2008]|nr:hypothetical protein AX17_003255 [Amanita inopinata Kibby_2008]
MNEWVLEATSVTLWHEDLGGNLSAAQYRLTYETVTMDILRERVKPELQRTLLGNMKSRLGHMLPQPLLSRLPESLLTSLPVEVLARIPIRVIKNFPDDFLQKLPVDLLLNAPDEILRQIPVQFIERFPDDVLKRAPIGLMRKALDELFQISPRVYLKLSNRVLFSLPEDLNRLPDELLKISLRRMQEVLERPGDPDWPYAVNILQRLPDSVTRRFPPGYRKIRCDVEDDQLETQLTVQGQGTRCDALVPEQSATAQLATSSKSGFLLSKINILRIILRVTPRPILERVPQTLITHIPASWLKGVPADLIAELPERVLAEISVTRLERLPNEFIDQLPESVLRRLPYTTIRRLPDTFLTRLPADFIKNIPLEVMENVSEELSDVVQEKISTEVFNGRKMMEKITRGAERIVNQKVTFPMLSSGLRSGSGQRRTGHIVQAMETHEELQLHILGMIRKHSRMVAQVTHLGMGEEAVYDKLRMKATNVWRIMRLHSTPPVDLVD